MIRDKLDANITINSYSRVERHATPVDISTDCIDCILHITRPVKRSESLSLAFFLRAHGNLSPVYQTTFTAPFHRPLVLLLPDSRTLLS